jgi:hypothetical protein
MKRLTTLTAVLGCAALILAAVPSFAEGNGRHLTPAEKQASDQAMQAGLSDLQSASSALQSNPGQAASEIQAAITTMKSAMGIYHGYRDKSIHAAGRTIVILQRNRRNAVSRAETELDKAISDAQAALQTN